MNGHQTMPKHSDLIVIAVIIIAVLVLHACGG